MLLEIKSTRLTKVNKCAISIIVNLLNIPTSHQAILIEVAYISAKWGQLNYLVILTSIFITRKTRILPFGSQITFVYNKKMILK